MIPAGFVMSDPYIGNNWSLLLDQFLDDPEGLIQEVLPSEVSVAVTLVPVLHFIGTDEGLESLCSHLSTIKTQEGLFVALFKEVVSSFDSATSIPLLDQFLLTNGPLSSWVRDGVEWLRIDLLFRVGELGLYESDYSWSHPWWEWQQRFVRAKHMRVSGEVEPLEDYLDALDAYAHEHGLGICLVASYNLRGTHFSVQGKFDRATECYQKAINETEVTGNLRYAPMSVNNLGVVYLNLGDYTNAESFLLRAYDLNVSLVDKANSLSNLGLSQFLRGDYSASVDTYDRCRRLLEEVDGENYVTGMLKLGLGLNAANRGDNSEALPLFNQALDNFTRFENLNLQIYLHAMVMQVFYDTNEYALAVLHQKRFHPLLERTKSYQTFFPYLCTYVLILLDQQKVVEAKAELDRLQFIAAASQPNRLVRAWYNFAIAALQRDIYNFDAAFELYSDVVAQTRVKGPFSLLLRSYIALAELNLRKYIINREPQLLELVERYLAEADWVGEENPIYPTSIYVKVYRAMLAANQQDWSEVERFLADVEQFVQRKDQFSLRKHLTSLVDQIRNQRLVAGDLPRGLVTALLLGTGRRIAGEAFQPTDLGLWVWKMGPQGPEVVDSEVPDALIPRSKQEMAGLLMGTVFISVLGQGDMYHEGLFGPLPVPLPDSEVRCLLVSKVLRDSSQEDHRLAGRNYVLVGLVYPNSAEVERSIIQRLVTDWFNDLTDLALYRKDSLEELRNNLLAEPLRVPVG